MYNEFDKEEHMDPQSVVEEPRKHMMRHRFARGIAYALVVGLVAGGSFSALNHFTGTNDNKTTIESNNNTTTNSDVTQTGTNNSNQSILSTNPVTTTTVTDVSNVVKEVMPSIVSITSTSVVQGNYFGQSVQQEQQGSGSGIIIGSNATELLIVTNNHVVSGAEKVEITFSDNKTVDAEIKGTDSSNDLAVVSVKLDTIEDETKSTIRIASIGNSEDLQVGEMVIAIGNALGYGQSVTVGYLSAKDREVQTEDYTMSLLQTDAAINPGNSGGALLNASGQLIGINSVKFASTEVEGMGYSIPISYAVPIINDLMNREDIPESEQAYLGIYTDEVTESIASRYNMPVGVYVAKVTDGSPASQYGLKAGDIITGFDGRTITTMSGLQELLSSKKAGTEITLTIKRQSGNSYAEKELKVTLGTKPVTDSTTSQNSENNNKK